MKPAEEAQVLAGLRARELISSAYVERQCDARIGPMGARSKHWSYVIDPDHDQYCQFDLETQARMIARAAVGGRGPNPEYLVQHRRRIWS